jgi:hypothetical protein
LEASHKDLEYGDRVSDVEETGVEMPVLTKGEPNFPMFSLGFGAISCGKARRSAQNAGAAAVGAAAMIWSVNSEH